MASSEEASPQSIRNWVFDHEYQARDIAERLNAGLPVTKAMRPVHRSYEAGWGLVRTACSGMGSGREWRVYGRGY